MSSLITEQDSALASALETAIKCLEEEKQKPCIMAAAVRSIMCDIAADALMPLPVTVQVLLPTGGRESIYAHNDLTGLIGDLKGFRETLL